MKLSELLSVIEPFAVDSLVEKEISGLCEDSRIADRGFLFFARRGAKDSGLKYISSAIEKGAAAIITEENIGELPVPVIRVSSIAKAQSAMAQKFYGSPSDDLTVVGVTGTNGKTTFTYLLESIAHEMGWRVGVIGTVNYRIPKKESNDVSVLPAPNTTPNLMELQKLLRDLRDNDTDLVVMEVSSHALSLGRVNTVEFDGAVFTNLTQDHLDYHLTMENYFDDKAKLFQMIRPEKKQGLLSSGCKAPCGKFCIINMDDSYGKRLVKKSAAPVYGYGIETDTDFNAKEILLTPSGTSFTMTSPQGNIRINMNLIGRHNVYNALASAASAWQLGVPLDIIGEGLKKIQSIPGRMEFVNCGQDFTLLVDYAHTEDALKNVLNSVRQFAKKRILTLFGCGGDRDRSKRPLMGGAAVTLSDWVIVTSDNPRSEDPEKIALDIEVGIHRTGNKNYDIVLDREEAIAKILGLAQKDDIVLLAGKGHETYQIFADETVHFDDREVAQKILCSR